MNKRNDRNLKAEKIIHFKHMHILVFIISRTLTLELSITAKCSEMRFL